MNDTSGSPKWDGQTPIGGAGSSALDDEASTYWRFTETVRAKYCDQIRLGARSHRQVCARLRLNRSTVDRWLARGREATLEGDTSEATREARSFVIEVEAAQVERDAAPMSCLLEASRTEWRAALAMVKLAERRAERRHEARLAELEARRRAEECKARVDLASRGRWGPPWAWSAESGAGAEHFGRGGDESLLETELEILTALVSAKEAGISETSDEFLGLRELLRAFQAGRGGQGSK